MLVRKARVKMADLYLFALQQSGVDYGGSERLGLNFVHEVQVKNA
jgi:hypothetical protein